MDLTGTGAGAESITSPGSSAGISMAPPTGARYPYAVTGTAFCATGLVYRGNGELGVRGGDITFAAGAGGTLL